MFKHPYGPKAIKGIYFGRASLNLLENKNTVHNNFLGKPEFIWMRFFWTNFTFFFEKHTLNAGLQKNTKLEKQQKLQNRRTT